MKISLNWLKDFIEINESPEEISEILTQTGLEVEGLEKVEKIPGGLARLVIGEVLTCGPHPNADKLKITTVDFGGEPTQIVCGAPNVAIGQKVVVAPVNTTLHPVGGETFKIKKSKIRGEVSEGMLCAEDEIGLGAGHDGILVLDTDLPNGTALTELYDNGADHVFEIGLTPNRGDATSHLGSARDLKAYFDRPIKPLDISEISLKEERPIKVTVENNHACPRYSGVTIRGIKIGPSPEWLQFRLRAIGQEPINSIVDITNFVMHHLGQPLHAFDADQIDGDHVIVKNLPNGTPFITLDEKERKLDESDLMICNESEGMCIAGVFGGIKSGIKETTTSLFLESAFFSSDSIRGTTTRHGLNTDAGFRFERGIDPEMAMTALQYATKLIVEIAGGYRASEYVDIYPNPIKPIEIATKFDSFDRLIGESLPHDTIIGILNRLDIETKDISKIEFTAIVPPYRSEVTREADLVEEVLRIYGINNIEIDASFSTGYLAEFEEIEPYKLQEAVSVALSGKGYREMITNSITNSEYESKLKLANNNVVNLLNPSSEDLNIMRPSMLFTGLESVRYNLNRRQQELQFFEFGKTYLKTEKYREQSTLAIYLTGKTHGESWLEEAVDSSLFHLMHAVETTLKVAGINSFDVTPLEGDASFDYGLAITHQQKSLGRVGKLADPLVDFFEIEQEVFSAEINWDAVMKKATREQTYEPISKYPEVRRDLSLVLDKATSYQEIQKLAFNSEKKLLNRMNVFSVYEGDKIETGKKSYAIAFYLQDQDKTLNDKQIDKTMSKLMGQFEKQLNAIIRR